MWPLLLYQPGGITTLTRLIVGPSPTTDSQTSPKKPSVDSSVTSLRNDPISRYVSPRRISALVVFSVSYSLNVKVKSYEASGILNVFAVSEFDPALR
jgi:hypothetical protein